MAGGPSLGMSPETYRGVVLSERGESKDDGSGAQGSLDVARDSFDRRGTLSEVEGLPGGLHTVAKGRHIYLQGHRVAQVVG